MATPEQQIANLQMAVKALEVASKNSSLPDMLRQTRQTIKWSSILIAIALIVSSVIRVFDGTHSTKLEDRIEALERATKTR
jgi:hypothetical protein